MHLFIALLFKAVIFLPSIQGHSGHDLYRDPMHHEARFVKHRNSSLNVTPIVSIKAIDNFCCVITAWMKNVVSRSTWPLRRSTTCTSASSCQQTNTTPLASLRRGRTSIITAFRSVRINNKTTKNVSASVRSHPRFRRLNHNFTITPSIKRCCRFLWWCITDKAFG